VVYIIIFNHAYHLKQMTRITIPCHWDKKALDEIMRQDSAKDIEITEMYGVLARGPVSHGRSPITVPDVTMEDAVTFRKYVGSLGLKFIYLLNAPFTFGSTEQTEEVKRYLDWIINEFKANALMVTSYELTRFIREVYGSIPIYISTIAGVLNIKQLEKFLDVNPSRVVVHHDTNRSFGDLKKLLQKAGGWGIEIELMATESCLRRCPDREAHYLHLSNRKADDPFHTVCNFKKIMYPREFLKANIIRPEDLHIYEKMGVGVFKITGRSKPSNWLPEITEAYLKRGYDGNLIRLLGTDPSLKAEDWIYVNNKALEGFLEKFPKSGKEGDENAYCDEWIYKLYKNGDFRVNDGSVYGLDDKGSFYCKSPGERVLSVISKEK